MLRRSWEDGHTGKKVSLTEGSTKWLGTGVDEECYGRRGKVGVGCYVNALGRRVDLGWAF